MEKLNLRRSSSQAKLLGTIVSVSGAFVVILYKGSAILKFKALSPTNFPPHQNLIISQHTKWIFGGLFLALSCLLAAIWNIVQVPFQSFRDGNFTCKLANSHIGNPDL